MSHSLADINDHGRLEQALNRLDAVKLHNTDPRITITDDEMVSLRKAIRLLEPIEMRLWRKVNA